MRKVDASTMHAALCSMIIEANCVLSEDIAAILKQGEHSETTSSAREICHQLVENARLAKLHSLPLCQDTGTAIFFVAHGENVRIHGSTLNNLLTAAMIEAYDKGLLRKSMCHPLTRANTGDNAPPIIHTELVPGDTITVSYMAKGGGSENMSGCAMLTPAAGWQGIKDFVVQRVAEAGPNPCPPTIIGVGIGGTFDTAPVLAKKGLFRPVGIRHHDPDIAALETELLLAINTLGIGPMGLGGTLTSLDVKIEMHPCHIASLPVAVNIQCHSSRHRTMVF